MKIHMRTGYRMTCRGDEGSALLLSLISLVGLVGLGGAMLAAGVATKAEHDVAISRARALYAAEAGVSQAMVELTHNAIAVMGDSANQTSFADGGFWGDVVDNGNSTFTIHSYGRSGIARRGVEVTVRRSNGGVFQNAIFAGNSSGDPNYSMHFGGRNAQADRVTGSIYSGGNIDFAGDSRIDGVPRASGDVIAGPTAILPDAGGVPRVAEEGVSQPIPDIAGMNYSVNHDVNVAAAFAGATYGGSPAGGRAWQLPASNPAHIFRKNPSDRTANWSATAKDDFFLEDPYEPMHTDANSDGTDPYRISLSDGATGTEGNRKVYYIDGNLWVHNTSSFSFMFDSDDAGGTQVTFVVRGNVYISDNIFMEDPQHDGIALIAIKDPGQTDSGNIYFGDPTFGTLEYMHAFMYAENNFYDTNLNAAGSARVRLNGNMTAGNQVAINRDMNGQHSKLTVDFDDRLATGAIDLPGLPSQSGAGPSLAVSMWREIGVE
jgi:hypothetical protein